MKTLVEHHIDHDVYAHQLDADERHNAAAWIEAALLPRVVKGWAEATDDDLAYEVRRLHAQQPSELTTLLLNLVTDEQVKRAVAGA